MRRTIVRNGLRGALCLALFLRTGLLHAQPTTAEIAVAQRFFDEAVALEQQRKWADAEGRLRQALEIKETPGLRFHLAFCEEKQGKLVEAMVDYRRAAELIRGGVAAPTAERLLAPAITNLSKRVPSVRLNLPKLKTLYLKIDDQPVSKGVYAHPIPLNPGRHTISVVAPGYEHFHGKFELSEGEVRELNVLLRASETAPPAVDESVSPKEPVQVQQSRRSVRPFVLIGEAAVALAGLGMGLGYTVAYQEAKDDVESARNRVDALADGGNCSGTGGSAALQSACSDLAQSVDHRIQTRNFATIGWVGAGVGASALVATLLLWPKSEAVTVGATPMLHGGFLRVDARF